MSRDEKLRRDLVRGVGLIVPVVRAVERREWRPTPAASVLLAHLRTLLREVKEPSR